MSDLLMKDVRLQYRKAFKNIRDIAVAFPEETWRQPHGDIYYIPSRIAYHLAVVIDNHVAGGFLDPEFSQKVPYGRWIDALAEDLPDKAAYLIYLDAVLARANTALDALNDADLVKPTDAMHAHVGDVQLGLHLYMMRELSDHTGELNKMLIEDGLEDIWISRP